MHSLLKKFSSENNTRISWRIFSIGLYDKYIVITALTATDEESSTSQTAKEDHLTALHI